MGTAVAERVRTAGSQSRVAAAGRTFRRYVMASFLYRWLTAEPDPDVIVIDLRETWTVGPVIAVLDRVVAALERGVPGSAVVAAGADAAAVVRARPVAVLSMLVLPVVALSAVTSALTASLTAGSFAAHLVAAVLSALGTRSKRDLEELRETRLGRLLVAAFEPPEPPAPARETDEPTAPLSSKEALTNGSEENETTNESTDERQ
ncbi:hypothetical protein [Natronobacterium lacisalsi]|uniref:hypothetical protein n=1 Tax=Natronobacterium lacisalsi TaxID=229731 RepID=UPI001EE6ABAA|nr:hypothetical protein [Halobiforma lacisalsi]